MKSIAHNKRLESGATRPRTAAPLRGAPAAQPRCYATRTTRMSRCHLRLKI